MKYKYLWLIMALLWHVTVKAQCSWVTQLFDGFENPNGPIPGFYPNTYYGTNNWPQPQPANSAYNFNPYGGSFICYMNWVNCGGPPGNGVCPGDTVYERTIATCPGVTVRITTEFATAFQPPDCIIDVVVTDLNKNLLDKQTNLDFPADGGSGGFGPSFWTLYQSANLIPTTDSIKFYIIADDAGSSAGTDLGMDNFTVQYCAPTAVTQSLCQTANPVNLYTYLTNTPVTTGAWTGPANLTGGYLGTYNPQTNDSGNYIYSYSTGVLPVCPTFTDTVHVKLLASTPITGAPSDTTICPNGNAVLNASGATTYTWAPATGTTGSASSQFIATPTITTTYTITGTNTASGCVSTFLDTVKMGTVPTVIITPAAMQLCSGRDTTLTAGGASTYTWAPNTGLSSTTSAAVITSATTTTTYTVTGTSSVGCTATATEIVNVLSSLTVTVTPANPAPVCLGSGIQLTASGATNYSWAPAAGASSGTGAIVTLSPTVATTYTIDGSNGKGCNGSTTVTIDVNPLPTVSAKPDTSVCPGQQVQMYVSGNGISYEWQPASGVDYNTIATPIATVTANTIYTVTSTSGDGCTNTALVTINTYPLPVVSITSNTTIPLGSSIDLFAYGGTKYDWRPDNTLSNLHIYNPIATPTHNTTYYVTIISENGCTVETSVTIDVSDSTLVFVPTAFTPNGDGVNDFLGILARGIFSLDYFKIYNRWGELVFTSNSLTPGWDGNFNGRPEPIGVYAYVLQGTGTNGITIQRKGNITLLR